MQLQSLFHALASKAVTQINPEITSIIYDSRKTQDGSLYVAIVGERSDGHDFIAQVIEQGAVAIVCLDSWFQSQTDLSPDIAWLPVANPRQILAELSAAFYGHPAQSMKMIGVTGTNGKTTTTQLIKQILQDQGFSSGWIGTLGAGFNDQSLPGQYTTPFPPELHQLLNEMKMHGVQSIAIECSSHALEQHRLDAIDFDIAIFSNLTQDHLDYHHTMQAYAEAKQILFQRLLKPDGIALIHLDDPYSSSFVQAAQHDQIQILSYGLHPAADLKASDLDFHPEGVNFTLHWQAQCYAVKLKLPGQFNVSNALAALGSVMSLGINPLDAIRSLEKITGVPGRMQRVSPDGHPFAVYVDYSHTPDSLDNALKTVREFTPGRVLAVFGCGGDRDKSKRPIMSAIAEKQADLIFLTSDNPRTEDPQAILNDMIQGLVSPQNAVIEVDRRQAIRQAIQQAQAGDVVLIAGKGHETYQIIGQQVLHFDDREEAQQCLENQGE